jgi:hypothetical protein
MRRVGHQRRCSTAKSWRATLMAALRSRHSNIAPPAVWHSWGNRKMTVTAADRNRIRFAQELD